MPVPQVTARRPSAEIATSMSAATLSTWPVAAGASLTGTWKYLTCAWPVESCCQLSSSSLSSPGSSPPQPAIAQAAQKPASTSLKGLFLLLVSLDNLITLSLQGVNPMERGA